MIDFRYHLVSIVAVLLALSIGIVLGTGILGDPLLDDIRSNVEELERDLAERRGVNDRLNNDLQEERAFLLEAEPYLVDGLLEERAVVIVEFEGTEGSIADELRASIELGDGSVSSTIEILDRFRLTDQLDSEALALAISSVSGEPDVLREEAAVELGTRLAAAAHGRAGSGATALLADLQEADFVDVERASEGVDPIPDGALFLIVGGGPEEPPYPKGGFSLALATTFGNEEVPVLVVEPLVSVWGMVEEIRDDDDASQVVATADGVQSASGRIAAVMGLGRIAEGEVVHLGRRPGADGILPQPTPAE